MSDAQQRELEYHEKLYSGFAQSHFARPAVRALRAHMVQRILAVTGVTRRHLTALRKVIPGAAGAVGVAESGRPDP